MPPNNTNSRKRHGGIGIELGFEERATKKCQSEEDASLPGCGIYHPNGMYQSKSQIDLKPKEDPRWKGDQVPPRNSSVTSLMDELLCDIYSKMEVRRRTSATTCDFSWQESDNSRCSRNEVRSSVYWKSKDLLSLKEEKRRLEKLITEEGNNLVKHLKRKNFLLMKRETHYDMITAYIQAISTKTREDTKMKFSLTPGGETGFSQWLDAMKMVAQLPGGMPPEFRTKLWLQLSEKHLSDQNIDWEKAEAVIFNEWTNPDDEELGVQIVKDLHRTGCSLFCGEQEHNQALLKRVLLAYARWNKNVGYCQGFNMLAALILQVMDKDEKNAVKVMIYLIEGVLPESYFANNLRGLSVDMAVFRDLLRLRLPKLSKHLEALQHDTNAGTSYEPPLTNVFTMQWFLTLFSNCLPQQTVLRVWDLVFLYGNEVLLRTALAIWGILQERIITVESADEFYSIMGVVTREMLEFGLMDANTLVKTIAMVDPFPNELQELREKYLYNISPWTQSVQSAAKKGIRLFYSDPDDQDDTEDEDKIALATAYGVFRRRESTSRELQISGPTLDISVLKQQYAKLRERQRQAHVIITAACSSNLTGNLTSGPSVSVNHLLMGKSALVNKGRRIGPPEGSIPPPNTKKGEVREIKKPKIVISGETFEWKDAEKRKDTKLQTNNNSNKKEKVTLEKENRRKIDEDEDNLNTNHDRMERVTEMTVKESLSKKEAGSGSSSSSTSTELCDDEFHRTSDFDSEDNSDASSYRLSFRKPPEPSPSPPEPEKKSTENGGCDTDNLKDIKTFAINLINEMEDRLQTSEKLQKLREKQLSPEVTVKQFDNTKQESKHLDIHTVDDNILKREPEVPIEGSYEERAGDAEPKAEPPVETRPSVRRKSDLGLSVIRENLEMLHKFSQKGLERVGCKSFEMESEEAKEDSKGSPSFEKDFISRQPVNHSIPLEQEVQKPPKTEAKPSRNFLVEKAISPITEKTSKAIKVNKEVNTELTFGVDEVEISTSRSKLRTDDTPPYKFLEKESPLPETSRESRFRERDKDEIKHRIETSKSDWELKMRKIAELETTTRQALNEIHARSAHRKSLHRSLDRTTRRTYLEDEFKLDREVSPPGRYFVPKIELESNVQEEDSSQRKFRSSGRSFDAITSRTEKLLGKAEFNRSTDETSYRRTLSPEFEVWKPKDSTSKFKKLIEESFGTECDLTRDKFGSKSYEYYSSPTSPEYRGRTAHKYSEFLSPKKYDVGLSESKHDEDFLRITQNGSKTSVDLVKKYSPEHKKSEVDYSAFNPFPKRSSSRPKELGVKLGLYPTSPEGQSKKS